MVTSSRQSKRKVANSLTAVLVCLLLHFQSSADISSAQQAMENPGNPLLQVITSSGDIFIEMFPREAPNNVDNVIALAQGEKQLLDPDTGNITTPNYYDGLRFNRLISGLSIEIGKPPFLPLGLNPDKLNDEINAEGLGLNLMQVLDDDFHFNPILNLRDRTDLENNILIPLYQSMGINSPEQLKQRQSEVTQRLQNLTIKQAYENQGYRFQTRNPTRPIGPGTVALANTGPDSNGPEFFISVAEANWLWGKYTVIGRVVEGMSVVEAINSVAVDTSSTFSSVTVIQSIRQVN